MVIEMKRIIDNEQRLDKLSNLTNKLQEDLDDLINVISEYHLLNKYYGSKGWYKDKETFEKGKYPNIKAGVLSEDAVWNLDEDIHDILTKMEIIIKKIKKQ